MRDAKDVLGRLTRVGDWYTDGDARHRRKGRKLASALLALRPGEVDAVEPTVPRAAAVALPAAFSPRLLFASYLMCLGAFTLLGTGVVVTGLATPLAVYAAVFAGGFAGGMLANRASPRGAILEPAAAGLLVGATLAGGWGWALETGYIARYAELTFVVVACAFLGALVGALAGQRTRAAPRSHSLARWSLVGAAIAAGALSAGIAALALLSSLGADLPSAAGLLGFLLWPIMTGVATQAVAPRRMPHAGALGCVMVFGLLVCATASTFSAAAWQVIGSIPIAAGDYAIAYLSASLAMKWLHGPIARDAELERQPVVPRASIRSASLRLRWTPAAPPARAP